MNDHRGNRGSQWVLLSNERFTGRRDREVLNGTKGITRLALRGSSDAVCRRISVKFGNGKDRDLSNIRLGSDRYAELDLPGARRDVRKISLTCQGVRSNDVVIGIYGLRS